MLIIADSSSCSDISPISFHLHEWLHMLIFSEDSAALLATDVKDSNFNCKATFAGMKMSSRDNVCWPRERCCTEKLHVTAMYKASVGIRLNWELCTCWQVLLQHDLQYMASHRASSSSLKQILISDKMYRCSLQDCCMG